MGQATDKKLRPVKVCKLHGHVFVMNGRIILAQKPGVHVIGHNYVEFGAQSDETLLIKIRSDMK